MAVFAVVNEMLARRWYLVLAVVLLFGSLLIVPQDTPRASGKLQHSFYVWQRVWTVAVSDAVTRVPASVTGLAPLAAEVTWRNGRAEVAWPAVDFAALRKFGSGISAVLRIGPCKPESADEVCAVARQVARRFRAELPALTELQVDFDCAQSQLAGYRVWLSAIRSAVAPLPVCPTVLPSWLEAPDFQDLARESGGYILQVHATERPRADAPETALCEMERARRWAERANKFGVAFRVALPTYTYVVAFAPDGKILGIVAEGESPLWPEGTLIRAFRPDATQCAALIAAWEKDRPAALKSVLWYRLPVSSDALNWRWPTLNAVLAGRAPRSDLRIEQNGASPVDIALFNAGESDEPMPVSLVARAEEADGVGGYRADLRGGEVVFHLAPELAAARLAPGTRHPVGWVRGQTETPIHVFR